MRGNYLTGTKPLIMSTGGRSHSQNGWESGAAGDGDEVPHGY